MDLAARVHRGGWAAFGLLVLLLAGAAALAGPAWADDEATPTAAEKPEEAASTSDSLDALEKRLADNPLTWILRFGPMGIGVLLLILLWLKWDKIRGGVLPAPPTVRPAGPFQLGASTVLALVALVAIPVVGIFAYILPMGIRSTSNLPFWVPMVATAVGFLFVAGFVIGRRLALQRRPEKVVTYGFLAPTSDGAGTRPPGLLKAFGLGWWTLCVAALVVIPFAYLWMSFLKQVGLPIETQQLVQEVLTSKEESTPWLIAFLGVIAAPLGEESLFRGMLYPALRSVFRDRRGGKWTAAITVSFLFALVHFNWLSLLPLFALAMVFTWVFEKTNSLAAVIFAHAFYNLFSLIPLLADRFGS